MVLFELLMVVVAGAVLGLPFGVAGSLLMALPMALLEEGRTPADAAASLIRRIPLTRVRSLDAWLVHFGAGSVVSVGAGVAFLALSGALGHVGAAVAVGLGLAGVLYGFFSLVVLPTRGVSSVRATVVRRHWLPSALAYAAIVAGGMLYAVEYALAP